MSRFIKLISRFRGAPSDSSTPKLTGPTISPGPSSTAISHDLLLEAPTIAPDAASHIRLVSPTTVAKTGDGVRLTEAASMRFVRSRTSIPVPYVIDAFVHQETKHACILMEYINGRPLDEVWDTYSDTQKEHVISQLKGFLEELRQIKGTTIGPVDGTFCADQFFDGEDKASFGPYESETAFNDGLVRALEARGCNTWTERVVKFIRAMPEHVVVFTHNDLAPRNILVRDGTVVAILDWEFSGFYPEYWEYAKALCWPDWQSGWIKDNVIDRILQPYLMELAYLLHAKDLIW
ncbi:MAG: hypothetical protein LQ346_002549 [Caloplaca aetnensis]|nr:MAG: hypothetical protein LQ346_002549 [Caloplaca aetnensis]